MTEREKVTSEAQEAIEMLNQIDEPTPWCDFIRVAFENTLALLKAQAKTINDLYGMYDGLCKEIREKYESDDVCGLCQYDGAYVGESGDWMNECPGFETNECFCMKNSIRKMCGQPLIEEP